MTEGFDLRKRDFSTRTAHWAAYAACGWAFLFAALSFFWAAGGHTGLHPLEQQGTSPMWIALNVGAGALKVIAGLIPLTLVRYQGGKIYRKLLFITTWGLGVGMSLYGGLGLVSDVLHVTGVISDPETWKWFFWYLVLWDPWWVLGGVLYLATAWLTYRRDAEVTVNRSTLDKSAVKSTELSD